MALRAEGYQLVQPLLSSMVVVTPDLVALQRVNNAHAGADAAAAACVH
jgi:hypothetical protein